MRMERRQSGAKDTRSPDASRLVRVVGDARSVWTAACSPPLWVSREHRPRNGLKTEDENDEEEETLTRFYLTRQTFCSVRDLLLPCPSHYAPPRSL